ncbi:uncharacterized protein LOC143848376 isoform X2 [Tasmannia lanceolata]|uniref:uncharacterized protein LOC143848376 isoform X2 n=1 Tax=Tasmannia lanceolata TaxID=3420 RepID=UPI0040627BD3
MLDDICFFSKDTLVIKPPKKSPLLLRMFLLFFAMICGVYICLICLKQISTPKYLKVQLVIERPCHAPGIQPWEGLKLHYPKPKTFSRGECSCNPVRLFAILSMQRSGSGWFETLLNSHINISSNGEIFFATERRSNVSAIVSTLDKVYNLDWFSSASKNECSAAVGFKWMLNQGAMEYQKEIVDYFNRRGVSMIFLFRRNILRRLISVLSNSYDQDAKQLNGTHKSHVHSTVEAELLAKYKPTINTTLLLKTLEQVEKSIADAFEYFKSTRHIILFYEDLINNRTKLLDVQEFLKVPSRDLSSRQVKIHTRPLSEQIENWDEVHRTLQGTQFENFLHADYQM